MNYVFLTLENSEQVLRHASARRRTQWLTQRIAAICMTALSFVIVFFILSAPAQYDRLVYTFNTWLTSNSDKPNTTFDPSQFLGHIPVAYGVESPVIEEGHLLIPSIGVDAPLLWNVPIKDALNGLQRGVVHVRESYLPGEVGRTFIVGHSSGYWWLNNPWTKVFALLDHASSGDLVYLKKDGIVYAYKITSRETVSPKKVDVIRDEKLDHNQLALMTCTPVGTSLNRLVLYAEPVPVITANGTRQ